MKKYIYYCSETNELILNHLQKSWLWLLDEDDIFNISVYEYIGEL